MEYAQLNEALTEAIQVTTQGNVLWNEFNFCSAEALTRDGKAVQFRVVSLAVTEPPSFNPMTQRVQRNGCEEVAGSWQYKWDVIDLTQEQIDAKQAEYDQQQRDIAKAQRTLDVSAIKVTTAAGNTFDGDEVSQGRMARAIIALSTGLAPSVNWVLANNTNIQATPQELTEALVLAGMAQAAIWII